MRRILHLAVCAGSAVYLLNKLLYRVSYITPKTLPVTVQGYGKTVLLGYSAFGTANWNSPLLVNTIQKPFSLDLYEYQDMRIIKQNNKFYLERPRAHLEKLNLMMATYGLTVLSIQPLHHSLASEITKSLTRHITTQAVLRINLWMNVRNM